MKKLSFSKTKFPIIATLLLSIFGCSPSNKQEAVKIEPIQVAPCIGYVKLPAPVVIGKEVGEWIKLIDPSGAFSAMVPMMLGGYGYPNFEEFSDTAPITAFFIAKDENPESKPITVIAAKLNNQEGPLLTQLKNTGFSVSNNGEWSIITQKGTDISLVKNIDHLLTIANETGDYDFSGKVYVQSLQKYKSKILEEIAKEELKNENAFELKKLAEHVLEDIEHLKEVSFGMNLRQANFLLSTTLSARKGTTLGNLFSQEIPLENKASTFVDAGEDIEMIGRINPEATLNYFNYLCDRFQPLMPEENKPIIGQYRTLYNNYVKYLIGSFAVSGNATTAGAINMNQVVEGTFTQESLEALLDEKLANSTFSIIEEIFAGMKFAINYEYKVQFSEKEIKGIPINKMSLNVKMPDNIAVPNQEQTYYIAACEGYYLSSASEQGLTTLIENIQSGGAKTSLVTVLQPKPGAVFQGKIDFVRYYKNILMANPMLQKQFSPIFKQLESANIPPATFEAHMENATLTSTYKLSLAEIAKTLAPLLMQGMK